MFVFKEAHPRSPAVAFGKVKGNDTLKKLNSFLKANEPKTVEWLVNFWNAQGNAITYKELREAVLSGGVSNAQLKKWQKQYANLVNTALAPQWYEAIKAVGKDIKAQYPYFLYEPFVGEMQNYIYKHGAELVTALAKEQKDALQAMITNAAHYSGMTPDDLSRLMRPVIGLTKPQSLANLNFYSSFKESLLKAHPNMTDASAAAKARDAAAKYAAKQHRYRAMNIARTELAAAYNQGHFGATKDAQAQGYIGECEKFFITADDERVCQICGTIDGETRKMDDSFSFGKLLPPVHPSCRCAVGYREAVAPLTSPQNSGTMNTAGQQQPQPANQPEIPPDVTVPNGMTYNGEIKLGGTGRMYSYLDADGNEWLFKPAESKGGKPEIFRAYSQEVGYKVQGIVDPDSAVQVGTGTLDGRFGAFQRRISTVSGNNYKGWQNGYGMTDADITPEMVEQFQREHVTDWLLGNFDSHGGNFVTDVSGKIIGIDKEQAFKYLSDASSRTMSYKYHPNAKYGETEPIYNTLFRKYAHGDIDLNPQNTLKYIQRLEAIPDSEYREIFRNYAESLCGKGKAAEQMLDSIVARKSSLRETYRTFYTDLMAERTGTTQTFKWADEIMGGVTPAKAPKVTVPSVKPAPKAPDIPKIPVKTASGYRIDEVMDDLTVLPNNQHGVALRSDGGMVEGLNVTGRRVTIDGSDYYEISGKLTEESWKQAAKTVKSQGGTGEMDFLVRDSAGGYDRFNSGMKLEANRLTAGGGEMEIYSDIVNKDKFGMAGYFRVRVPATGNAAADKKAIQEVFDKSGLTALTSSPTDADELLLKKTRIAWQRDPAAFEKARYLTGNAREKAIDDILKKSGIDLNRVNGMTLKEVFPGYSTYVDEAALAEYQNAGLTHIWAGVGNSDSVVAICKSDGFAATNYRITSGMKRCGASPDTDMCTGGSDGVFTRIGVNANRDYSDSYLGGRYRVIIDPKEMTRTDWWAHKGDEYGVAKPDSCVFSTRLSGIDFVKSQNGHFNSSNEIIFRHGISTDKFIGISCENEAYRRELLTKFKSEGITEFNGIPIDKFVTVTTKVQEDSARGLAAALNNKKP